MTNNAFDETLLSNLDNPNFDVSRELRYPSFSYVDSRPIYSNNYVATNSNQQDLKKAENTVENLSRDVVGASFYILDRLFKENNWVSHSLKTNANAIVGSNPLFKIKTKASQKTTKSKYQQLFEAPNAFTTGFELFNQTALSLEHYGNAYWQVIKKVNGDPHSIYFIPAHMIRVIPYIDKNTNQVNYVYAQVNGINRNVDKYYLSDEIIHFKMPNHLGQIYGLSKLVPLFRDITFDIEAKNYINSWFTKAFSGGMIFKMENSTREVVNRNRTEMREKFEGASNAGRNLILEGDMQMVYDGNKARDINLGGLKQISRDDILACLGTPLSLAGVRSDIGQANAEVIASEEKTMLRNTVLPTQRIIFDTINLRFFKAMMQEESVSISAGANSSFVSKNAESIVKTMSQFGGATVNENREMLGFATVDDQENFDQPLVATNNGIVKMDALFTSFEQGGKQGNATVQAPSVKVSTTKGDGVKVE